MRINSGATGELDLIHIVRRSPPPHARSSTHLGFTVQLKAGKSLKGIVIPKVDSPDQVRRIAELIEQYGGEGKESIRIIASIESPIALMRLQEVSNDGWSEEEGLMKGHRLRLVQIGSTLYSYVLSRVCLTALTRKFSVCVGRLLCSLRSCEDTVETGDAVRSQCDRSDCESLPTLR